MGIVDMENKDVYLHRIRTAVPPKFYSQEHALKVMEKLVGNTERKKSFLNKIYKGSAIGKRHTVIEDYDKEPEDYTFYPKNAEMLPEPSTEQRNDLFIEKAPALSLQASRELLESCPDFDRQKITHLITVSCTGFTAPGIDFYLMKELGLNPGAHRFNIGFMGCYAAFPALKMARDICRTDNEARVMIVNTELCSIHFQQDFNLDTVVANAIFADGISAALVSAYKDDCNGSKLILKDFVSTFAPGSEEDMAWKIGSKGFTMKLSAYVPKVINDNIKPLMDNIFNRSNIEQKDIDIWAIHPGGKGILEKLEGTLELSKEDFKHSYNVLHDYGNMSSATIMFVFRRLLEEDERKGTIFSAGFGPGLTIESAIMEKIDG